MGRRRASKFSFPLPGRWHAKEDHGESKSKELTAAPSLSSMPSVREHPLRYDDSSSTYSKAQRVLGTAGPPFRPGSRQTNVPPSPGYISVTISDTGSDYDGRTEDGSFQPPRRPNQSNRASSNILPPSSMAYIGSERPSSVSSSVSRLLRPRASDSTIRSHYDSRSSPLAISQQTSDSAVRDMALRKGKPQIMLHSDGSSARSPKAQHAKENNRKTKPQRLDLSKLFPKPRSSAIQPYEQGLLSPSKMVNSPTAMSIMSDHFPRPMTREPTPSLKGHAKLTKSKSQQSTLAHPGRSMSPSRLYRRDTHDHAKINVRRPPQGVKHWFDALGDESDEMDEDDRDSLRAPMPINPKPSGQHLAPQRKSSLGLFTRDSDAPTSHGPRALQHTLDSRKGHFIHANPSVAHRLTSPSQHSLQSQTSQATSKTKDSSFSKSNLQNSSVLSFSSSEDEDESVTSTQVKKKVAVRDSIDMTEDHGDIVIGQAQAFPMRPSNSRRPSVGKLSMLSTSTNAATIEVMYSPEPYAPQHFPRFNSGSRRSSHLRQPSIIREGEDEDARPRTAANRPPSPSTRSVRTSAGEARSQIEAHKFMAVTPEEEALLDALRKKRAAMAQQSWVEGYHTAIKHEEVIRQTTPPESKQKSYRTSAFLSLESPSISPVRVVETKKKPSRKSLAPIQTPVPSASARGRSTTSREPTVEPSMLRDSSCDLASERPKTKQEAKFARRPSPPPEFSPLDPFFPSPPHTVSIASPATIDHPSPIPSPVTPGLRHGESEVCVKVASSEPSFNSDDNDDVAVLATGVIDTPAGSIKPEESQTHHPRRRRTASSGTDAPTSLLPNIITRDTRELVPVSEASSRTFSVAEPIPSQPKIPKKSSLRKNSISISTTGLSKHSSITSLRTSSPTRNPYERRSSRAVGRVGSMGSIRKETSEMSSARNSVSDDVLAAWGSLGGNYERPRY
ncbi:hypothetical protein CC80DRAFT_221645 [Byssothecium circinans]|uniref:Uncharacterized protein n=1 Tax=Byssothecium circinans TaxID=147558 RepID=A0A6A5TFN5_9PLEO|nr:hypothetical protein CC80DRAFT_221645 [Byssothecium circinans]